MVRRASWPSGIVASAMWREMPQIATTTRSCRSRISALLSAKPVKNVTLKVYKGHSHGMAHPSDVINADLLAFIGS